MLFSKKYYKIVRSTKINNSIVRHSCFIPLVCKYSIRYYVKKWTISEDLFVHDNKKDLDYLKNLTKSIATSFSVIDPDDCDDSNYIRMELWECLIGKKEKANQCYIMPLHKFLEQPEVGKNHIQVAKKNSNHDVVENDIITDRLKLVKCIFTHYEKKIKYKESIKCN